MAKGAVPPTGVHSLTLEEASRHGMRTLKGSSAGEKLRPPADGHGGPPVEAAPPAPAELLDETTALLRFRVDPCIPTDTLSTGTTQLS